jgi:hypothetical protein
MITTDIGAENLGTAHELEDGNLECEVIELRNKQAQLVKSLELLMGLLEEYAPSWYTEEHHTHALAALRCSRHQQP